MSTSLRTSRFTGRTGALALLACGALFFAVTASAQAASGTWNRAWGKDVIASGHAGDTGTGFEICTVAADCKSGTSGGLGGGLSGPGGVATDAAGNVYVADNVNQRIQKFDSSGGFLRAWGKDVASAGPGNTGSGFEICVAANGDTCQAGTGGGLGGEFSGPTGVATDAAGNVYVTDKSNQRIQKFDSSGSFLRAWGKDVASAGPGNTGTGFEVCVAGTGDTCKAGTSGGLGGELDTPNSVATDAAGNVYVAESDNQRIQKFADPPPAPPTFTSTSPASPANDNAPKILGSAESGSAVRLYANSSCSGSPVATDTVANFASPGITVTVADNSTTTFHATAANAEGNTSACSIDAITYTEDSTAPNTTIDSGPSGTTNDSTPAFSFSSSESGSTFECKLDGGSLSSCSSPDTIGPLADGSHTFQVQATDQVGNTDPSPASQTFTVDTQAPQTTILEHPNKETTSRKATFKFKSSEPGSSFKCKLDRQPFKPCSSPKTYKRLKPGKHVFKVRATDPAGNADPTPAKWAWTIKK